MSRCRSSSIPIFLGAFVLLACDDVSGGPSSRSSDATQEPTVPLPHPAAPVERPLEAAPAVPPSPTVSELPRPAAPTETEHERIPLVEGAATTVADGLREGVSETVQLLSQAAGNIDAARARSMNGSSEPVHRSKTTAEPPPSKPPKIRTSGRSCDVEAHHWKSVRVPLGEGGRKAVKLKNGRWDGSDEETCHWVTLAAGPVFGDLNDSGGQEAYIVIEQTIASKDFEGMCTLGMSDMSQALLTYELDEACKPRLIGSIDGVGQCEFGWGACETLSLRIQGKRIAYGRERFGWSGDSFRPLR